MLLRQFSLPALLTLAAVSSSGPQCPGIAGEKYLEGKEAAGDFYECDIMLEGIELPTGLCKNYLAANGQKYLSIFNASSGKLALVARMNQDGSATSVWDPTDLEGGCR